MVVSVESSHLETGIRLYRSTLALYKERRKFSINRKVIPSSCLAFRGGPPILILFSTTGRTRKRFNLEVKVSTALPNPTVSNIRLQVEGGSFLNTIGASYMSGVRHKAIFSKSDVSWSRYRMIRTFISSSVDMLSSCSSSWQQGEFSSVGQPFKNSILRTGK